MPIIRRGCYRLYAKVPFFNLGIKIAVPSGRNKLESLLAAIIMNLLEYKRYRYYSAMKIPNVYGAVTRYYPLCPTYITLGFLNVVKHLKTEPNLGFEVCVPDGTPCLTNDNKMDNYGYDSCGNLLQLDYGDFNVDRMNRLNVRDIDYM